MKKCLFSGPTLYGDSINNDIDAYQPAMLGSVFRAVEADYRWIGIVDGYFGIGPQCGIKKFFMRCRKEFKLLERGVPAPCAQLNCGDMAWWGSAWCFACIGEGCCGTTMKYV